jgi:hypothetical protein
MRLTNFVLINWYVLSSKNEIIMKMILSQKSLSSDMSSQFGVFLYCQDPINSISHTIWHFITLISKNTLKQKVRLTPSHHFSASISGVKVWHYNGI